jgi:hypothetical protein
VIEATVQGTAFEVPDPLPKHRVTPLGYWKAA